MARKRSEPVTASAPAPAEGEKRVQVPVRLTAEMADRLDRLIWHTGKGRTKQRLLEQAIKELVEDIEAAENGGKPFPPIKE